MSDKITLAIEAAIGGGSLALTRGRTAVAAWEGEPGSPRSEELLVRISEIMESAGVSNRGLERIIVSNGPGSYTGIRVGIATAIGLASSRGLPCIGISILNSIARAGFEHPIRVVVLPVGRGNFCWRRFTGIGSEFALGDLFSGPAEEFAKHVRAAPTIPVLAQSDALADLRDHLTIAGQKADLHDIGRNLARTLASDAGLVDEGLEPFYARDAKSGMPAGGPFAGK